MSAGGRHLGRRWIHSRGLGRSLGRVACAGLGAGASAGSSDGFTTGAALPAAGLAPFSLKLGWVSEATVTAFECFAPSE